MLIQSIQLRNFLSYGAASVPIKLGSLNVIIGSNGSGKSNFLEAFELLRAAPTDLLRPIRDGGGVRDWLQKGIAQTPIAKIDAVIKNPKGDRDSDDLVAKPQYPPISLRYVLRFTEVGQRFEITDERIENAWITNDYDPEPYFFYHFAGGHGFLNIGGEQRRLRREDIDPVLSILAQRKDPDQYPELTYLGEVFAKIRLYREWGFGRYTAARLPQKTDLPNEYLQADCSNLGLVLNRLRRDPAAKQQVLRSLSALYDGITDFDVQIEGGTVQLFLQEEQMTISATRLSDGTLRYLCLLAILCNPAPGPLVCIEEPELGLHPDVLPTLAQLLQEASRRTQLIVTTHSDILVDALSDVPEAVLVAEHPAEGTQLQRLDPDKLRPWLEEYRLGELWTRGELGGTRW